MEKEIKVPVECYTRVVGFFRPVSQFNPGKQEEYKERLEYKVPQDL
jgi:ribonucleoside-triphosphate reductase